MRERESDSDSQRRLGEIVRLVGCREPELGVARPDGIKVYRDDVVRPVHGRVEEYVLARDSEGASEP